MSILREHGDKISPSHLDVRMLIALGCGLMNAYQVARQAEADSNDESSISNGMAQACLRRLEATSLIQKDNTGNYQITWLGKDVLASEVKRLERLVGLARTRL